MICTRCGTQNSKTSKFCRECGKRLVIESIEVEVEENEQFTPADDAVVAEYLHASIKSLERGKLESALAKCKLALRANPNSTSGHSLLAMIYEKKASQQFALGNREDGEDFLRAAIRQIERVLDMNPDSVADREKLDELLEKLDDLTNAGMVKKPNLRQKAQLLISRVPLPVLAGAGTFAVVFILLTVILVKGKTPPKLEKLEPPQAAQLRLKEAQSEQLPPAVNTPTTGIPQQQAGWTYQPQQTQQQVQQPQTYAQQPGYQQQQQQYSPLPPVTEPQTQLSPYPVAQVKPVEQPKETEQPAPTSHSEPVRNPSESARAAYMKGDYASAAALYEQAINSGEDTGENQQKLGMCLYNLNKREAALKHFQRAVQLYMAQKAEGANVNAAIDTCKLYIDDLSRR